MTQPGPEQPTPPYGQQPYGQQPAQGPPQPLHPSPGSPVPLRPDQERTWAMLSHLLSFAAAYVALGLIAPLIVLLVYGPRSAFVKRHATESLNFNITTLLVALVSVPLMFVIVGFFTAGVWAIYYLVAVIIASVRASAGEEFRYPVNIRLVR